MNRATRTSGPSSIERPSRRHPMHCVCYKGVLAATSLPLIVGATTCEHKGVVSGHAYLGATQYITSVTAAYYQHVIPRWGRASSSNAS